MGERSGRPGPDPSAEHGTRSRYTTGCRCAPCRDANAVYGANHRRRRKPSMRPYEPKGVS